MLGFDGPGPKRYFVGTVSGASNWGGAGIFVCQSAILVAVAAESGERALAWKRRGPRAATLRIRANFATLIAALRVKIAFNKRTTSRTSVYKQKNTWSQGWQRPLHITSCKQDKPVVAKMQTYVRVTDHEHRLGFQRFQPEMKAIFV